MIGIATGNGTIGDAAARAMAEQATLIDGVKHFNKFIYTSIIIFGVISASFFIGFICFKNKYKKSISIIGVLITCFVSILISTPLLFIFSVSQPKALIGIFAVCTMHPEFWDQGFNSSIYNTTFKIIFLFTIFLPILTCTLLSYYSSKFINASKYLKWILTTLIIVSVVVIVSISLDLSVTLIVPASN
ncbi:MAG: hypothetical protein LBJ97_01690 [Mycoplasmataceae bacterium]|nr:hypothetical protein [Mycoplasmataceae bacterium]